MTKFDNILRKKRNLLIVNMRVKDVTSDNKVSRRHFLKILAAGATTLAFGSILGFQIYYLSV